MKINEIYSDILTEDTKYEFKAILNPNEPLKWAKTIVAYANLFLQQSHQTDIYKQIVFTNFYAF